MDVERSIETLAKNNLNGTSKFNYSKTSSLVRKATC
jgi:hypothetical protein